MRAVDGIDFDIAPGETLVLLGESGCGKSISALSLLQLVPEPAGRIVAGQARLRGQDVLALPERDMRTVRGKRIAMIFQEPQTSLNPVLTVGEQISEAIPEADKLSRQQKRTRVAELLKAVGIADAARRYDEYPFQLSGGMKQRVMIAMALAAQPDLLIADEPTTALDVTIQAQILALLKELQKKTGMAILLITHDLGVVAEMADRVAVMYAGQIVELAPRKQFFSAPQHPYSRKLFRSVPGRMQRGAALEVISGSVPSLRQEFRGCRFADRCDRVWDLCHKKLPAWIEQDGQGVRCHLYDESVAAAGRGASVAPQGPQNHIRADGQGRRGLVAGARPQGAFPDSQRRVPARRRPGEGGGRGVARYRARAHAGAGGGIRLRQDHGRQGHTPAGAAHGRPGPVRQP